MRQIDIGRQEAEMLVDLLEECDPAKAAYWRFPLAAEVREVFGMCPLDPEKQRKLDDANAAYEADAKQWKGIGGQDIKALVDIEAFFKAAISDDPAIEFKFGPMLTVVSKILVRFR